MTTKELEKAMISANAGSPFIKIGTLCDFLGDHDRYRVRKKYLLGLEMIGKCYFIPDVAAALRERSTFEM